MSELVDTSDEACAVVCMIVSDPSGSRQLKPGWKKQVNDLIRALRDERNALREQLATARRETWEEAAKIADAEASTRKFTEGRGIAIKIAEALRSRATKVKEGK